MPSKVDKEEVDQYLRENRVPDTVAAEKFNITRERIRQIRAEYGLEKVENSFENPVYKHTLEAIEKIKPHEHLLGKVPDSHIRAKTGVSLATIKAYREWKRIPKASTNTWKTKKVSPALRAKIISELTSEQKPIITTLVAKYKVSRITICRIKKQLKIEGKL